jgi:hypothetical protein
MKKLWLTIKRTEKAMMTRKNDTYFRIKLFELRYHIESLITFINSLSDPEVQPNYSHFQTFREIIISKHQTSRTQQKWDAIFMRISRPKPVSLQPSISSANGANLSPGLTINMEEEQSYLSSE